MNNVKIYNIRDMVVDFFDHWTGHASNCVKMGTSGNAPAKRLENKLFDILGDKWYDYQEQLIEEVSDILDEYPAKNSSVAEAAKQVKAAWPEIVEFLTTTDLIEEMVNGTKNESTKHKYGRLLKESKEDVIFDSSEEVPEDLFRDWCEQQGLDYDELDDEEKFQFEADIKDDEMAMFLDSVDFGDRLYLVHGTAGRWDGDYEGGKLMYLDKFTDFSDELSNDINEIKVAITDEGLVVTGYHHDGENTYIIDRVTRKGEAVCDRYAEREGVDDFMELDTDSEMIEKLLKTPGCLEKIKYASEIGY